MTWPLVFFSEAFASFWRNTKSLYTFYDAYAFAFLDCFHAWFSTRVGEISWADVQSKLLPNNTNLSSLQNKGIRVSIIIIIVLSYSCEREILIYIVKIKKQKTRKKSVLLVYGRNPQHCFLGCKCHSSLCFWSVCVHESLTHGVWHGDSGSCLHKQCHQHGCTHTRTQTHSRFLRIMLFMDFKGLVELLEMAPAVLEFFSWWHTMFSLHFKV